MYGLAGLFDELLCQISSMDGKNWKTDLKEEIKHNSKVN